MKVLSQEQGGCDEDHECARNMHEIQKRPDQRRQDENKNEPKLPAEVAGETCSRC